VGVVVVGVEGWWSGVCGEMKDVGGWSGVCVVIRMWVGGVVCVWGDEGCGWVEWCGG